MITSQENQTILKTLSRKIWNESIMRDKQHKINYTREAPIPNNSSLSSSSPRTLLGPKFDYWRVGERWNECGILSTSITILWMSVYGFEIKMALW